MAFGVDDPFWSTGSKSSGFGRSYGGGGGGGGGKKSSPTRQQNNASSARYAGQGAAYKASGQLSDDGKKWMGKPDPGNALEDWLNAHDTLVPGSGGSAGTPESWDFDSYYRGRDNANARVGEQRTQLNDLYGDYLKLIKDNPEQTQKIYDTLIKQGANAGQAIAQIASQQANKQDAQRMKALASLGVSANAINASPSETKLAEQRGLQNLAAQNASWQGLQGTLGAAQVARDKLDIQGVSDAKVLAQRQLTENYEQYMRQLDAQLAASYQPGTAGSAGTPDRIENKYRGKTEDAIFKQILEASLGTGEQASAPKTTTSTTTNYDTNGKVVGSSKKTSVG